MAVKIGSTLDGPPILIYTRRDAALMLEFIFDDELPKAWNSEKKVLLDYRDWLRIQQVIEEEVEPNGQALLEAGRHDQFRGRSPRNPARYAR
jgi:hypothetical protein